VSDNYPDGAANDKRAPWNQEDETECPDCEGYGTIDRLNGGSESECQRCSGKGYYWQERDEDFYEDDDLIN
jgi:DnaJ-class molecular chaperone